MYKIFADDTLIYDSTLEDYKIGKGSITLEINKSGSFTFSVYPDHFFYDRFVKLKTVITVYKSGKIIFRGRILNDVSDYWNNKVITCEGELGFLQDSIIRPFEFSGSPRNLLAKFITDHNAQVDDFKRFKIGTVDIDNTVDENDYVSRSNSAYESALSNISGRLLESSLGGYIYITHGDDGTDTTPTLNYVTNFSKVSSQTIEFGSNLKDYTKTVKAEDIVTAIIPLGAEIDDGDDQTEDFKLTISSVNSGRDYVYSETGVGLYGWIFKTVEWEDVTDASELKRKAETYLNTVINQNISIDINAIDLHLLDPSIESINTGEYVRVRSEPHNFNELVLCSKQTIDLLNPGNDSYTLGFTQRSFTDSNTKIQSKVDKISVNYISKEKLVTTFYETKVLIEATEESILQTVSNSYVRGDDYTTQIGDVNSRIEQLPNLILQSVSEQYVTESEFDTEVGILDARITQTAESIKSEVSATYATKDSISGFTTSSQVASMINQSASEITQSVSATYAQKTDVINRNLLKGTATSKTITGKTNTSWESYDIVTDSVTKSQVYNFSADVEILEGTPTEITVEIVNALVLSVVSATKTLKIENGRISGNLTPTNTANRCIKFYAGVKGDTSGNSIIISNAKLEKGKIATEWSATPEDYATTDAVAQQIRATESKITQTANEITQTVSATYATKDSLSDYATTDAVAQQIRATESKITQTAESITQTVSATYAQKTDIPGRNLLLGTATPTNLIVANNRLQGATSYTVATGSLEKGQTYNFSADVDVSNGVPTQVQIEFYTADNVVRRGRYITIENGCISANITPDADDWSKVKISGTEVITDYNVTVSNIKLEKGGVKTAWSLAPEEDFLADYATTDAVAQQIQATETKITQTAESITATVSANYATKGELALQIEIDEDGNAYSKLRADVDKIVFNSGEIEIKSENFTLEPDGTLSTIWEAEDVGNSIHSYEKVVLGSRGITFYLGAIVNDVLYWQAFSHKSWVELLGVTL